MRDRSSGCARMFFADKEKVLRELRAWAARLRETHPEAERVGLFGSFATGTYGPRSDVDLLILLRASGKPFRERIPDFLPAQVSAPCDVFPYTTAEIENLQRDESPWIQHVLREVVWLEGLHEK
jgi:predicted nucleotidyltransferase